MTYPYNRESEVRNEIPHNGFDHYGLRRVSRQIRRVEKVRRDMKKYQKHDHRFTWMSITIILFLLIFVAAEANSHFIPIARANPDEITIGAQKDNTLYESDTGDTSNGVGSYFFAGSTMNGDIRRGVIAFDIAGNIPAGSTINSVTLMLNLSRTMTGDETVALHRLLEDWGEGTSNADANEGMGAPATEGDATWIHTFFDTQLWTTAGGSFDSTVSGSTVVGAIGPYSWGSTAQMVADVQGWLDDPSSNFGWILIGDEANTMTAKRFDSLQNSNAANRPMLTIDYNPPATATATETSVPPTATETSIPPTATNTPTETAIPPTATNTSIAPTATNTSTPPSVTDTPTSTPTETSPPPTATETPPGDVTPTPTPLQDPIPSPIPSGVSVLLKPVASGLTAPNWGVVAPNCLNLRKDLFVTDQIGIVWRINNAFGDKEVFLDVSSFLVNLGIAGPGTFDERGLLGIAFDKDYAETGLFYTYTSEPVAGPADFSTIPVGANANHQSVIREWQVPNPCDPIGMVDSQSSREILRIDQPQFNHDGGALVFGPDDMLYISLGDGGAADDQGTGHVPGGNGQDPSNVLGTILRIDPTGSNSANGSYGIPPDNPFVGQDGYVPEIYAYGFRNPFRISFDRLGDDLYVADVGQNDIEEIHLVTAGGNYGWNLKEGSFCFNPNGTDRGFVTECAPGQVPDTLIDPIAEYDHDEGVAIIGGFVYRGYQLRELFGDYIFGEYRRPGGSGGRLFYLQDGQIYEFNLEGMTELNMTVLGFAEGANGDIFVLMNSTGTPFGETGAIFRMLRPRPKPVKPQLPEGFSQSQSIQYLPLVSN